MKEYFQIDFACGFILTAARILITEVSISPFSQCSDLIQTDRRTDGHWTDEIGPAKCGTVH